MSLDNVIAVAAAAGGSVVLLILGLAISIPLVIFGSTLLLKLMERWPVIITIGAGLIGFVAGEMVVTDPAIAGWVKATFEHVNDKPVLAGVSLEVHLRAGRGRVRRRPRPLARPPQGRGGGARSTVVGIGARALSTERGGAPQHPALLTGINRVRSNFRQNCDAHKNAHKNRSPLPRVATRGAKR